MMKNDWHGIMKILTLQHWSADGNLIAEHNNILNLLHLDGEEYILRSVFAGGDIPANYYMGLDARVVLSASQTMDDLTGEPSGSGYERQEIASGDDFTIDFNESHFVATSPIVTFRATSGSWGPVTNLFLTNEEDNTGYLISSAVLPSPVTLNAGETVTVRIRMQLKDCP